MKYLALSLLLFSSMLWAKTKPIYHPGDVVSVLVPTDSVPKNPTGILGLFKGSHGKFFIESVKSSKKGLVVFGPIPAEAQGRYKLEVIEVDYAHAHIILMSGVDFAKTLITVNP